jgi:hypothetical protein
VDPEVLKAYTGYQNLCCPWHQHELRGVARFLEPGSLELRNISNMVRIVPETADYLYTEYTPLETQYEPGSRLSLEAIAEHETVGAQSDVEKAKLLCEYVNREVFRPAPNHWEYPGGVTYYGGRDEEIIARKSKICNDIARVFCALCQIVGIPARIVYNLHVVAEAFVDGGWSVFDLNYGLYHVRDDGRLASAWDIQRDRSILESHPRYHSLSDAYKKHYYKLNAVVNYFLWTQHTDLEMKAWKRSIGDLSKSRPDEAGKATELPPCPVTGEGNR